MGGKASRDKGKRGEYLLRDHFRSLGWVSHRVPSSGAAQGAKGDVTLEKDGRTLRAELKCRKNEFKSIYALYPGHPVCVTQYGASCILSHDFGALGYTGDTASVAMLNPTGVSVKKLMGLKKLVKECDFLVIKIDYQPFLFIRYL